MQKRYSLVWYVLMCDTNAFLTCADTQQLMYIASLSSVIMDIFLSKDVLKFSNLLWKSVYSFLQYLNLFSQRNNTQNWPQKRIPACRAGHILNAWFKTFCTHHQHYGPIIFTKLLHQTSSPNFFTKLLLQQVTIWHTWAFHGHRLLFLEAPLLKWKPAIFHFISTESNINKLNLLIRMLTLSGTDLATPLFTHERQVIIFVLLEAESWNL